jgi:hypothetical protein
MNIWRINLKSSSINNINPRQYCLLNNIVGVGWRISEITEKTVEWAEYHKRSSEMYGNRSWKTALNAIKHKMQIDDLIWTRDIQNNYFLGRITSDWQYQSEMENLEADIVNIRNCDWVKIGTVDSVPGKLVNSFIPARTLQKVNDKGVKTYSKITFNRLKDEEIYKLDNLQSDDIFSLLSSDDCEDLIAMYLQVEKGYYLIPSSCKSSMMGYEFELKHKITGQSAVVQVKNGFVNLNADSYDKLDCEVYLFTTKGNYIGTAKNNIYFIARSEIEIFMEKYDKVLPHKIRMWKEQIESTLGNSV